ncbi:MULTISPECIES: type IV secretion system protein [Brevundimonas]|uniref:Type IV secretion system protein n=1 Tax=Brevundimonas nasdae TaxID=172043 RepID=A0ABX8TL73_9CAUL|nr:type IV secretion system protein [Brevundimonas nasdae]QYC11991.1 type IV secretion system protein [Brevundimonas nasdae]QYC14778.1 type IV secretion system protein [Brevundimonas nasdae]
MRRSILSIAVALAAMTAVPAHAQQVVYDPTSFAQMVKDARTAIEQLDSLKAQVQQGEELFASLNDLSDVNAIAERLGLPEIRNPLPDMATLRSAADGNLSALGELAERADAIRRETRVYTPDAPSAAAEALERSGARTARDLAIGETVDRAATDRLEGLETLRRALDTAPNARAVMDLNARLAAEQALIQNEQVRLQGLALTQAAEARLEDQRARERIAAERSARMDAYRQAFQ